MALKNHGPAETRSRDLPSIQEDVPFRRRFETRKDIENGGLTASRMSDEAYELALSDAEPQVLKNGRDFAVLGAKPFSHLFDLD
jgi:hypothetical protein